MKRLLLGLAFISSMAHAGAEGYITVTGGGGGYGYVSQLQVPPTPKAALNITAESAKRLVSTRERRNEIEQRNRELSAIYSAAEAGESEKRLWNACKTYLYLKKRGFAMKDQKMPDPNHDFRDCSGAKDYSECKPAKNDHLTETCVVSWEKK